MPNHSIKEAFRGIRFASGLSDEDLEKLIRISDWIEIPEKTTIFAEGAEASCLFLIVRGRVELSMNIPGRGMLPILTLEDGDLLGGSAALFRGEMTLTASTILNTEAIQIHAEKLRELCDADHDIGYEMMQRVARALMNRLEATRLQVLDVHHDGVITQSEFNGNQPQ